MTPIIAAAPLPGLVVAVGFHLLVVVFLAIVVTLVFRPQLWFGLLALFFGLLAGFIDFLADEPQLPVLMLLAGGFFIAFGRPQRAWRWALLVGAWVPLGGFVSFALRGEEPFSLVRLFSPLLALIPATIGAYAGAFISRASGRGQSNHASTGSLKLEEP